MAECKPYLEHRKRETLFREAVIAFICGSGEEEGEQCRNCRASAGRIGAEPNCKDCDKRKKVNN